MSIANYSELQTAVGRWLHRPNLTAIIPDFIALGESRVNRVLRLRAMETSFEATISSGTVTVPDRYAELKFAYIDGTPTRILQRKTAEWVMNTYPTRSADGKPSYIARDGDTFIFGPYPDSAYTVKATYYRKFEALSDSNTSNWLTANAGDLLLFASLCEAAPYLEDDSRIAGWEGKYSAVMEALIREDEKEEFSGGPLSIATR
jgi:hypothetical protein